MGCRNLNCPSGLQETSGKWRLKCLLGCCWGYPTRILTSRLWSFLHSHGCIAGRRVAEAVKSQYVWVLSKLLTFWQGLEIYMELTILFLLLETSVYLPWALPRGCFSPTSPSPSCRSLICILFCKNTIIPDFFPSAVKKEPPQCFHRRLVCNKDSQSWGQDTRV